MNKKNVKALLKLARELGHEDVVPDYAPEQADPMVWDMLQRPQEPKWDKDGNLKTPIIPPTNRINTSIILDNDPFFKIEYNEHSDQLLWNEKMIGDPDLEQIALELEKRYRYRIGERALLLGCWRAGAMNQVEPIKEWLEALEWDGKPRIERFLVEVMKVDVPQGAEKLIDTMSKCWFISCAARIIDPGSKVDTCLTLVGPKGCYKSTALRMLCGGEWFSDSLLNISKKEAYELIHQSGVWIWELAELHALQGKTADNAKQFLSSAVDRYRPSYARMPVERKRRTVFVASTNNFQFLSDGPERRFWPVKITEKIDTQYIEDNREELWAEAVHLYKSKKVPHHLPADLEEPLEHYQQSYIIDDPWTYQVLQALTSQNNTTSEIMNYLKLDVSQQHTGNARRIAQICRDNSYEQKIKVDGKSTIRYWQKTIRGK